MADADDLLDVPLTKREIQGYYAKAAPHYDEHSAEHEDLPKGMALDAIARRPGESYLEVAVGTGASLMDQIGRSGSAGIVGLDLTPTMLGTARGKLGAAGESVPLLLGDARHLPFRDGSFDCLLNTYMLDLIPTVDLPTVVAEFRRVLKPGGRLSLVSLTEAEGSGEDLEFINGWKSRYRDDAMSCGGCRPLTIGGWLADAGFERIERTYCGRGRSWPSEVVTARRPAG